MNNMSKNTIGILIAAVVVIGGLSFYGGMKYASAQSLARNQAFAGMGMGQFRSGQSGTGRTGANGIAGRMMGGTYGQIISKDDKSITVKLADGGSKIVFLSQTTTITKNTTATVADLTVGSNVIVGGAPNQDGSVNAQFIQLGADLRNRQPQTTPGTSNI